MEYHSFLFYNNLYISVKKDIKVSVSLWSIIHSYYLDMIIEAGADTSFRLLMEYHSFLYK